MKDKEEPSIRINMIDYGTNSEYGYTITLKKSTPKEFWYKVQDKIEELLEEEKK